MSKESCLQFEVVSSKNDRIYSYNTSDFVDAATRLREIEESGEAIGIAIIDKINRVTYFFKIGKRRIDNALYFGKRLRLLTEVAGYRVEKAFFIKGIKALKF